MDINQFDYRLPERLIAQYPLEQRTDSRLLCLDGRSGAVRDRSFTELGGILAAGDLLVLNDTKVIPARIFGHKPSGGKVEVLVDRALDRSRVSALIRASKAPRVGTSIEFNCDDENLEAIIERRDGDFYTLRFSSPVGDVMGKTGHVPLPPYIRRSDGSVDAQRYQTVYARRPGAAAAPTAGLHFDHDLLRTLRSRDVDIAFLTLHVGAGSFQPVRAHDVRRHSMHAERVQVSPAVCAAVSRARARGGRVVAVGTTVVRALETAARSGELQPVVGDSRLFIYPGHRFRGVDALITNFHLPRSTLLMLVCAFAGTEHVLAAYAHAVAREYRFYSYGDAMFVTPQAGPGHGLRR